LESVFAQQCTSYEVIVVDDGSSDETESVVNSFGRGIKFLRQQNRGPGAARNLGRGQAVGRYLAFLDSDDLFFPWSLNVYAEVIAANRDPSFVAGKPRLFREDSELTGARLTPIGTNIFRDYLASGDEWRWWGVSSFVIRRDQLTAAGGFTNEPINGEDADLALRLGTAPGFVQITAPETFAYRRHANNVVHSPALNLKGAHYLIAQEEAGAYPGQNARARERRRIITRHVKPAARDGLRAGLARQSWLAYRRTLAWNLALGHWKFVLGFPVLAASRPERGATTVSAQGASV
jgi:glycosyltransferase involved in cell wall biosynthesis